MSRSKRIACMFLGAACLFLIAACTSGTGSDGNSTETSSSSTSAHEGILNSDGTIDTPIIKP